MFIHKYKTDAGPAYLASGSQKPKSGVRLSDWEGKATGSRVDSALKILGGIPMFKEDEPEAPKGKEATVITLANKVREFASFLTPKE